MNIFIGSLPYSIKESDLKGFFEEYGEVSSSKIIIDKTTGKSKGYGFVEMADEEAGKRAIEELNGAELEGRTIVVNEAREKTENNRGQRRGNNNHHRNNYTKREY